MRLLVDEYTGPKVVNWLREQGHEVFSVYHDARGLSDEKIIEKAFLENWILVTNDKDFGEKVFREKRPHRGIILLRLEDERASIKIKTIERLLSKYKNRLIDTFPVATENKARFVQTSYLNDN